jgi:phosphoribosylaminoimidazolecarboxamide formyltransferase/IMP cyclohydrolase
MKRFALISLSDKTAGGELASRLEKMGYCILSTSKTARFLRDYCAHVEEVSDLTGFPEILDGRIKTLHPVIHAGILANRQNPQHLSTLRSHAIDPIDIVAVNLYPFEQVLSRGDANPEDMIENIDIGGPTLLRAAAKNYQNVVVLSDPADYPATLEFLDRGEVPENHRKYLAAKVFAMVSRYDSLITSYLGKNESPDQMPAIMNIHSGLVLPLRYGENPHQKGAYYCSGDTGWIKMHGKELSFNNLLDMDAALKALRLFDRPTTVIVKHSNPCGIGSADSLADAYAKAFAADPLSPFGGIIAVNRTLDMETAVAINKIFTEIILAPDFAPNVMDFLRKKKDRRIIMFDPALVFVPAAELEIRALARGYLAQQWDRCDDDRESWTVVTDRQPTLAQSESLAWAWKVVSVLRSNAIAITAADRVLGLGIGQTSRVDSTSIAINKAVAFDHDLKGAVCASDGFFPYRDSVDILAKAGIGAIIQPGGSKSDSEVINACNEYGMAMVFTGRRHFRH